MPHEKEASSSSGIKEGGRRNRSDPSAAILEQLLSPLHSSSNLSTAVVTGATRHSSSTAPPPPLPTSASTCTEKETNSAPDMRRVFGGRCESALCSIGGGAVLLDVCLRLPAVNGYSNKYKELLEGKGFAFPSTVAQVHQFKTILPQLVSELSTVVRILHLPILEPLNSQRLQKLASIAMASLLASLHVAVATAVLGAHQTPPATASNKGRDDEFEGNCCAVTEKALLVYAVVLRAIGASTRAGGHHYQNMQLMGAWLLATGLHNMMLIVSAPSSSATATIAVTDTAATPTVTAASAVQADASAAVPAETPAPQLLENDKPTKDDKTKKKDSSAFQTRINLSKVQNGLSPVSVALSQQCCTLLAVLLQDVAVEGWTATKPTPSPARLSILETFTATDRLARIFTAVPLNQLLFYLATTSYRKVRN